MWYKEYRDYQNDAPLKKEQLSSGKGIVGCEMHEQNGWGVTHHEPVKPKKKGLMTTILDRLFSLFGGSP